MTATIVGVGIDTFAKALDFNHKYRWHEPQDGQRCEQLRTSVMTGSELLLEYASAYWRSPEAERAPARGQLGELSTCKARLVYDSQPGWAVPRAVGGYVVLEGKLLAFHSMYRGQGLWLLDNAVADGATELMCHDVPHLLRLYGSRGFKITKQSPDTVLGRPDVVWMKRNGNPK